MKQLLLLTCLLSVVALSACGASDTPTEKNARATLTSYVNAVAASNGAAACAYLSPTVQAKQFGTGKTGKQAQAACEKTISKFGKQITKGAKKAALLNKVNKAVISIDGDKAVVTGLQSKATTMEYHDGKWQMTS